ncbi:MAG: hypothetical protein H6698_05830 [Myxococcales bacterium]|nr:hypothetical protein [Myxococcales bacterium]MCB9533824.1 hypothetical protein [Myxococcales bacterium]
MTEELKGDELDAILDDLHRRMDRLRVLYEQYFLGIEKIPPYQVQKDVVRIVYRLQQAKLKGTSQKFRFQALIQKFNAQRAYWARTMREIEEGTYRRQTFRAENRKRKESMRSAGDLTTADYQAINMVKDSMGEEAAAQAEAERRAARSHALNDAANDFLKELGVAPTPAAAPAAGSAAPAPATAAAEPRKPAPDIRGMTADEVARKRAMLEELRNRVKSGSAGPIRREEAAAAAARDPDREVFERLVATKRRLNEATDALSFDSVKQGLEAQRERVRAKHGVSRVEFDVVERDGKAFLKPIPVKE